MTTEYNSGTHFSGDFPDWKRDYYSLLLLETLRTKSIMVPYCAVKTDYSGANSGVIVYTEVMDTEPDWSPLSETDIWLRGAHLDSQSVRIELEIHGDVLKFSDYSEVVQYVKKGDMRGLVRNKIGQNQVDYLDILARNAFAAMPNKVYAGSGNTDRSGLAAGDLLLPGLIAKARVHLEENDIPGVMAVQDVDIPTLVCTTTPRAIYDMKQNDSNKLWDDAQKYAGATRIFTGEVGAYDGTRFVRSNRLRLRNHGAVTVQTAMAVAAAPGDGAARTVDVVYTVGQSTATPYITVDDVTSFAVGQYITISSSLAHNAGTPPVEADGSQETRRIVGIDVSPKRIKLNKPLLKPHAIDDWVTHGLDVHLSIVHGGPSVVYGVAEAPHVIAPPTYDDLMMINRYGWRGFLKFQPFRPEFVEVIESTSTAD